MTSRAKIIVLLMPISIIIGALAVNGAAYFYPDRFESYRLSAMSSISSAVGFPQRKVVGFYNIWKEDWAEWENPIQPVVWYKNVHTSSVNFMAETYETASFSFHKKLDYVQSIPDSISVPKIEMPTVSLASIFPFNQPSHDHVALNSIEPSSAGDNLIDLKVSRIDTGDLSSKEDNEAGMLPSNESILFDDFDEPTISAEAVLVPRSKTVVSSSRDGKIAKINFDNGDSFKKGDVLLEYRCAAVRSEIDAAVVQNRLARERRKVVTRLYDMNLASKLEKLEVQVESKKAQATKILTESQNEDCIIRADYDGRVVKRLANPGEYTRTDRILMEVASVGTLDVEFLLPSLWLRWVNTGAPVGLTLHETGKTYSGKIKRIFGEVDPVSQSIQVRANLDDYDHPLLPGMSGEIVLDIRDIRSAGVRGFLDVRQ